MQVSAAVLRGAFGNSPFASIMCGQQSWCLSVACARCAVVPGMCCVAFQKSSGANDQRLVGDCHFVDRDTLPASSCAARHSAEFREFLHPTPHAAVPPLWPAAGVQPAPGCCPFFACGWLKAVGRGRTADGMSQQLPEEPGAAAEGVSSSQSAPGAVTAAADAALHAERDADARRKWCSFRHVCGVAMYQEEEEVRALSALPHLLQMGVGSSDMTSARNTPSRPCLAAWELMQKLAVYFCVLCQSLVLNNPEHVVSVVSEFPSQEASCCGRELRRGTLRTTGENRTIRHCIPWNTSWEDVETCWQGGCRSGGRRGAPPWCPPASAPRPPLCSRCVESPPRSASAAPRQNPIPKSPQQTPSRIKADLPARMYKR